jgi:hypothetical protein
MTYYIDTDLHRLNFKCPSFICPPTVRRYWRRYSKQGKQDVR